MSHPKCGDVWIAVQSIRFAYSALVMPNGYVWIYCERGHVLCRNGPLQGDTTDNGAAKRIEATEEEKHEIGNDELVATEIVGSGSPAS
ncbi:MAG: hypothetical protein ACE361_00015 [Aureliella sp.]